MTTARLAKGLTDPARLVAVIASRTDLRRALALRIPPDFFELRLDALDAILPEVRGDFSKLRAPLIITARHPREGGLNNLHAARRRELLLQFLPMADYVDVEIRSARELEDVMQAAPKRIISLHQFGRSVNLERSLTQAAALNPDIFKLVIRTETAKESNALLDFFARHKQRHPISAMGTGRLGREARLQLALAGSVLNYVHLGSANIEGQLSLTEMRRALKSRRIL